MRCTIGCECGYSLGVDPNDRSTDCPECGASYAVTVTKLRTAESR